MPYHLGVDLGTTYTAAAVERDGVVRMVTLGNRTVSVPSVLFFAADGSMLVGDAAERRGLVEPERLAREFKRRVGDPTPIILGGTPWSADALMGRLLRWVVDRVSELEGEWPAAVALTHPANWGEYKLDLLRQAARQVGVEAVRLLSEPEAAATSYASHERLPAGAIVAVYDLGGGTFDAAILRKRDGGFDIAGQPDGIERLGGIDVDQAVYTHVAGSLGGAVEGLDPADREVVAAVARLRRECVEAKEVLSSDTDVSIPVTLPGVATEVRLTRDELEQMVRPALLETVAALRRALRSAGLGPEHLWAVLLVGGASRMPLVAQLVGGELGRPIAVDANPKDTVALGAAVAAAQAVGAGTPESVTPVPATEPVPVAVPVAVAAAPVVAEPPYLPPPAAYAPAAAPAPASSSGSSLGLVAAIVAFVVLAGVAAFFLAGGDDSGDGDEQTTRTIETGEATTTTSGDDDDTTTTTDEEPTTTEAPTTTAQPTTSTTAGYTPEIRMTFVDGCVAGQTRARDPQGLCGCYWDALVAGVPFADFVELDMNGQLPENIDELFGPCDDEFA